MNKEGPQHCGTRPKTIAFGIAPLGIISIGIVPMGVISIGVVPMGVISFGAVAMGIVNLSIVGMGIFSAGITTMGVVEYTPGINKHNHNHDSIGINSNEEKNLGGEITTYRTRKEAEDAALELNCEGAHQMGENLWMPCSMHIHNH